MKTNAKTVLCDIDGTIFKHIKFAYEVSDIDPQKDLLPGVREQFEDWNSKDYTIVLTTGRPPSMREITNQQLQAVGLFYHELVMGLPRGPRVLINDLKPGSKEETAVALNLTRDTGMEGIYV